MDLCFTSTHGGRSEGNPSETVGNNNTGENKEAGDEPNERGDVRE